MRLPDTFRKKIDKSHGPDQYQVCNKVCRLGHRHTIMAGAAHLGTASAACQCHLYFEPSSFTVCAGTHIGWGEAQCGHLTAPEAKRGSHRSLCAWEPKARMECMTSEVCTLTRLRRLLSPLSSSCSADAESLHEIVQSAEEAGSVRCKQLRPERCNISRSQP